MPTAIPISAIILDTILKATVLLTLAAGAAFVLKKRSAATRHMVRSFTLVALLLLPLSVMVLPEWPVKGLPGFARSKPVAKHSTSLAPSRTAVATSLPAATAMAPSVSSSGQPGEVRIEALSKLQSSAVAQASTPTIASTHRSTSFTPAATSVTLTEKPASTIVSFSDTKSTASPATPQPETKVWKAYLPQFLLAIWIAGAIYFLLRWRWNALRLAWLVRRSTILTDSGWNAQVRALSADLGINRHVALLVSNEIEVPITAGIMFPKVVLSPDYCEWSEQRRSAILNHELAHISRLDAFTQALAQLTSAVYWFHPLVWLMARAMRAERERACDDQVLASGTKASDYAHELLDIVSELRGPELAAALAMARRSQLEGRVLAVLNPSLRRGPASWKTALGVAALTLSIMLPLAALRPAPQATTPAPKANSKKKPSPASTPTAQPNSSAAPAVAGTPSPKPDDDEDMEPAEAPEPPEPPEPAEAAEAPEPREPPEPPEETVVQVIPGVPATPAVPAIPAVPGIPAIPAIPAVPAVGGAELSVCGTKAKLHNMNMESRDGYKSWTATWSGGDCSVDLRAEGEIKFNAEATEIQSISQGGFFEVNLRQDDTLKQVKVTPSAGGLQYVYKVNGTQQPFTGEAKTWFSQFLLALERSTGFSADTRVPALLAKGGPTAVLDEISNLQGDYVRGRYFRLLLEQPNLPSPVVQRIIKQAGDQINSDYEMARVLMTVSKQYDLPDEASRTAFLNAAGKLKSDYEHSRVLIELLKRPNISRENVSLALKSAGSIKSDYEKSRILLSLLDQKSFEQSQLDFYLQLVDSIHSDYEKSRDLLAPMQRYTLAADQINRIMNATATINSDYEKSRLLLGLAGKGKFDEGQMTNYLKVVDSMKSDYERSRTLLELMKNNNLSQASINRALENISRAQSDYEKSRVITTLVQANKFDETQMASYLSVVDSMHDSDFERSRCLLALMEHNKLSDASLAKVLTAVTRMKSDYEKARVLLAVAKLYPLTGTLRDSYLKTADSISGEYERNRVLAAVVKRATL
ncbi:MAG TPA: M56 family metallopeptidase [Candidatus Angelobacter sp.]|jgi:beta-lactamase regulating signal transducer with metallopeptidase domain